MQRIAAFLMQYTAFMPLLQMPENLVYVRHGQSLRNLAGKMAFANNDLSLFDEVINRPSSVAPLSSEGVDQAIKTGTWLRHELGFTFDAKVTSTFNRAKQTAGLFGLDEGCRWYIENGIRERSAGVMEDMTPAQRQTYLLSMRSRGHLFDPFNFRPDRGESYADVAIRKHAYFGTLSRSRKKNVLVTNHGDNMWVLRYLQERWTPEEFVEKRGDGHGKIPNCMVLHYTRIDPASGEITPHLNWMRTCCPWRDPVPTPWQRVIRKSYTSADLLAQVEASLERCRQLEEKLKVS